VLLGAEAARVLSLSAGKTLTVNGRSLVVSGLLEATGSQDDQLAFVTLATAQQIFAKPGKISMAEVAALCKDCPIEDMVRQISAVLPGAKVWPSSRWSRAAWKCWSSSRSSPMASPA